MDPQNLKKSVKPSENKKDLNLWDLSSLGVEFAFIIGVFIFLGDYIDEKFTWAPFGIILFSMTGFVFGIYYLIHRTKKS